MAKETLDTVIACPPLITEKVRQFDEHLETYTSGDYSEAQLRVDFLNPMIKSLGWDVNNENGYAEAYRDVVYEDAIKVGGTTKAPDYGFYIGGRAAGGGRKFFLEAKKPSVPIRVDSKPAFQLRRYAYSAQLPLSILTNFKEFIAYDTRFKPSAKDNARAAAVLTIKYTEYAERWHEIASVFSREAILRGAFDKFAKGKRKKGMEPLGESFLKDIEGWRALLASEIAKSNPDINVDDLNFAVQRTIDRILFLRICEDRGIEPAHNLMALLNGGKVYARLGQIFRGADDRYNSGIFHFPAAGKKPDPDRAEPPDDLTLDLTIGDQPLKHIIRGLYDTGQLFTSYAFAVIPPEILGHVYEQFLGKVIRLAASRRVKIEEKPEVRKAGGVYYTPVYIVDYIVKNTVGKLLEGKTPKQAQKLRVLDPASGSGSFLIDWHLRWYLDNDPKKHCKGKNPALMRIHSPSLDEEPDAPRTKSNGRYDYRLTTAKRKDILLNSIYGVDIDPQAVEVTKLSLLLKVLEGESQESIAAQMKFLHQRALPDLGRNIKCGNSLIGDDFDDSELSEEERKKINKFNWKTAFPSIFKTRGGGFDAVIGNPPWGQKSITDQEHTKRYVRRTFPSSRGIYDLFRPFVERGIQLTTAGGSFGMVLPDIVLLKDYPDTRHYILEHLMLDAIDWWGMAFSSAVIDATTIIGRKVAAPAVHRVRVAVHDEDCPLEHQIPQADFVANPRHVFNLFLTREKREVLTRLDAYPKVGDFFEIHEGVHSGNIRRELFVDTKCDGTCREMYFGRDEIAPHSLKWNGMYIRLAALPAKRSRARYANAGRPAWYDREKLVVRRTGDYVLAAVDRDQRYASNNFFIVFPSEACSLSLDGLCALFNSRFITWFFRTIEPRTGRVFAELKIKHIRVFPLPVDVRNSKKCRELNSLGEDRATAAVAAMESRTPHAHELAMRQVERLESRINGLVDRMFGVSSDDESDARLLED